MTEDYAKIAHRLFDDIRAEFSHLESSFFRHEPNVSVGLAFERQPGLPFKVALSLQDDELHLYAGQAFHCEWFPCTIANRVADYSSAARGILNGDMRIVEFWKRGVPIKAEIQEQSNGQWKRTARWVQLNLFWFTRAERRVLQNVKNQH